MDNKMKLGGLAVAVLGMSFAMSGNSNGATAFSGITGTGTVAGSNFIDSVFGYDFTVGSDPISLTAFGYYDADGGTLTVSTNFGIYEDPDGPGGNSPILRVSLLVGSGRSADSTEALTNGNYSFFDLASAFQLSANTTYRLAATVSDGTNGNLVPGPSIAPTGTGTGITIDTSNDYVGNAPAGTGNLAYPSIQLASPGFDSPLGNFKFAVVPEPSAALLGFLSLGCFLRRRR